MLKRIQALEPGNLDLNSGVTAYKLCHLDPFVCAASFPWAYRHLPHRAFTRSNDKGGVWQRQAPWHQMKAFSGHN